MTLLTTILIENIINFLNTFCFLSFLFEPLSKKNNSDNTQNELNEIELENYHDNWYDENDNLLYPIMNSVEDI